MYKIFRLPKDFLDRTYKPEEKVEFDAAIAQAMSGHNPSQQIQITEALSDLTKKQKEKIDGYSSGWHADSAVKREHDRVFGQGNDRIVVPLDRSEEPRIHSGNIGNYSKYGQAGHIINSHLQNQGYAIHDYVKGLAVKNEDRDLPNPRTIGIGKLFNKMKVNSVGAPIQKDEKDYDKSPTLGTYPTNLKNSKGQTMDVNAAFSGDALRQGGKGEHVMVVSRNKYDVGGMSTNQGWSSCMNMGDGINRHFLEHDIANGTLTAYLAHKDHEEKGLRPLGRINLKRHDSDDGKHTVFVPESSGYGTLHETFKKAVKNFADTNYPLQEKDYNKHESLYNDDGKTSIKKRDYSKLEADDIHQVMNTKANYHIGRADSIINNFEDNHDQKNQTHDTWSDAQDAARESADAGVKDVHETMKQMKPEHHFRVGFQNLAEHEDEHRGMKDTSDFNFGRGYGRGYDTTMNSHDMIGHAFSQNRDHEVRHMLSQVPDHEMIPLLNHAHQTMNDANNPDDMIRSMEFHGHLIDAANKRTEKNPDIGKHLHDLALDNPDYYKNMENETGTEVFSHHPAFDVTNPREIHTRLIHHDSNYEGFLNVNTHSEMNADESAQLAKHVGKHADDKLAHAFHEQQDSMPNYKHFVSGLNENPNGKKIQHSLMNRFYADDQEGTHDVVNERNPTKIEPVWDNPHTKEKMISKRTVVNMIPQSYSHTDGTLFHTLSTHSAHASVLDELSKRQDVPDHIRTTAAKRLHTMGQDMSTPLNEGHVGNALEKLAASASDPLQRKFLHHLTIHLKKLLDKDYHFYKGHKDKDREEHHQKHDGIREHVEDLVNLAPADYRRVYEKIAKEAAAHTDASQRKGIMDFFDKIGFKAPEEVASNVTPVDGTFLKQAQDWKYGSEDSITEESIKAKKKKELKEPVTPVIINPDKTEI